MKRQNFFPADPEKLEYRIDKLNLYLGPLIELKKLHPHQDPYFLVRILIESILILIY